MPKTRYQKAREIHVKLLELAQQESPFDELEREQVLREVRKKGGSSTRSMRRYIEVLEDFGLVERYTDDIYKVYPPEDDLHAPTGQRQQARVQVDASTKRALDDIELSPGAMMDMAVARYTEDLSEYVELAIDEDVNDKEAEYIAKLITHGLHKKGRTPNKEGKYERNRERWYKVVFQDYNLDGENFDHIDELRELAFDVAVEMGLQETVDF